MTKNPTPLFIGPNNEIIDSNQVLCCLADLGVKKGDNIMIHSDLSVLGRLCLSGSNSSSRFLRALINVFKEAVTSRGTIIMPTFSYSFLKGEIYDINNSPSTAGILTEFFRKQKGVIRTINPDLSFAVWGKNKQYFTGHLGKSSFGKDSVFDRLNKKGGKIILFGPFFGGKATFMHYIEEMHGVSYRHKKIISGLISDKGKKFSYQNEHNARMPGRYIVVDGEKFIAGVRKKGILKEIYLGDKLVQAVDVKRYFNEGKIFLRKSETGFLDKKYLSVKNDFRTLEKKMAALEISSKTFPDSRESGRKALVRNLLDNKLADLAGKVTTSKFGTDHLVYFSHPGLDEGEVVIVCEHKKNSSGSANMLAGVARLIYDMPVQLKYSYRFILKKDNNNSKSQERLSRIFPRAKYIFSLENGSRKESGGCGLNLPRLAKSIYLAERDAVYMKHRYSYRPRLEHPQFKAWVKKANLSESSKRATELVHKSSNGFLSLAAISQKERIDFRKIVKAADALLQSGFLTEIG
jgi:aminoglycoside 3-N-acetyltransferase